MDEAFGLEDRDEEDLPTVEPMEILSFVARSARRHWFVGTLVAVATIAAGLSVAVFLPRKYQTHAVILVGQEGFMAQVNPERLVPKVDEFRGVTQRMFRQDNLRAIVEESDLARLWTQHRPPLLRFKDRVLGNGLEHLDEKTRMRVLMGTLEQRLMIDTDLSTTITIGATWTDPETATRIVEVARRRFLEDRLQGEVEVYEEVLAIQEDQAKAAARNVERFLKQVEKVSWYEPPAADSTGKKPSPVEVFRTAAPERREPDPFLVVKLEKVRERIRETKEPWQRRLMELKLTLSDLRASYAAKHPLVIHQESRLQEASIPPPELEALQAEERELTARLAEFSRPAPLARRTTTRLERTDQAPEMRGPIRLEQSATISAEQSKLIQAINKYNEISERMASTRLEIAAAETAFRHRYSIATEAEKPDAPLKPKMPLMIALASIMFGVVFGIAFGPVRELLRGRVLEPWQVKRLGLKVVGDVSYHSLAEGNRYNASR